MTSTAVAQIGLFATLGLGIGLVHFLALRLNTMLYAAGGAGGRAIALHIGRMLLTLALFTWMAWLGALALLAAFGGFLVARPLVLLAYRRWR